MSELTFEFDSATREPNDDNRMRNVLVILGLVGFGIALMLVGMTYNRVSTLRLRSRVQGIETRLQEIEERLPTQPAPALMEGGVR